MKVHLIEVKRYNGDDTSSLHLISDTTWKWLESKEIAIPDSVIREVKAARMEDIEDFHQAMETGDDNGRYCTAPPITIDDDVAYFSGAIEMTKFLKKHPDIEIDVDNSYTCIMD